MSSLSKYLPRILAVLLVLTLLAGCAPEPEPEPEEEEPPPPSAGEIASDLRGAYSSVQQQYMRAGARVPEDAKERALQDLRSVRNEYRNTENGPEGISRAAGDIEDMIREANDREAWSLVVFGVEALKVLEPDNERFDRYADRAQLQLDRPQVEIRGFYTDQETGQTMAFLEVYLPAEDRRERVQVAPGEEFLGLRFDEIIGRNRGIRFEYLATNEMFEVSYRR